MKIADWHNCIMELDREYIEKLANIVYDDCKNEKIEISVREWKFVDEMGDILEKGIKGNQIWFVAGVLSRTLKLYLKAYRGEHGKLSLKEYNDINTRNNFKKLVFFILDENNPYAEIKERYC